MRSSVSCYILALFLLLPTLGISKVPIKFILKKWVTKYTKLFGMQNNLQLNGWQKRICARWSNGRPWCSTGRARHRYRWRLLWWREEARTSTSSSSSSTAATAAAQKVSQKGKHPHHPCFYHLFCKFSPSLGFRARKKLKISLISQKKELPRISMWKKRGFVVRVKKFLSNSIHPMVRLSVFSSARD